jgi:hypothetical protein
MPSVDVSVPKVVGFGDETLVKLAREIAMDIHAVDEILNRLAIPTEQWEIISQTPRFRHLLEAATAEWGSALNTTERVRIKAATVIEEWLPEADRLLHDKVQLLSGKVEVAKLLRDLGGIGKPTAGDVGSGEHFSVTINLGADAQLKFERKPVTSQVIDGEVNTQANTELVPP